MDAALFSPSSLFQETDGEDGAGSVEVSRTDKEEGIGDVEPHVVERRHSFPGMELMIREFSFHYLNANLLWPGTFTFSEWLLQNQFLLQGQRILELGSGTGALAIFLRISFGVDITTSDFDDEEIEENIAYNCRINELAVLPHVRRKISCLEDLCFMDLCPLGKMLSRILLIEYTKGVFVSGGNPWKGLERLTRSKITQKIVAKGFHFLCLFHQKILRNNFLKVRKTPLFARKLIPLQK